MSDEVVIMDEDSLIRESESFYEINYHLLPEVIDLLEHPREQKSALDTKRLSKRSNDSVDEPISPEELKARAERKALRAKRRLEKKALKEQLNGAPDKATELVVEARKNPSQRKRICAALEKGEKAVDQMIGAVVTAFGVNVLHGAATTAGISPVAVVVATTFLVMKMGSGYFCVDAE